MIEEIIIVVKIIFNGREHTVSGLSEEDLKNFDVVTEETPPKDDGK